MDAALAGQRQRGLVTGLMGAANRLSEHGFTIDQIGVSRRLIRKYQNGVSSLTDKVLCQTLSVVG